MSMGKKVLLTVYLVVITALCVVLLCAIFGAVDQQHITNSIATMFEGSIGYRILYAAIAIILIIVGVFLIFFDFGKKNLKAVKIASVENGSIMITVKAIEELVSKYLKKETSIKEIRSSVSTFDEYVEINVDLSIHAGVNIPETTMSLHEGLRQSIESQTGIAVKDVKILVQSISGGTMSLKESGAATK